MPSAVKRAECLCCAVQSIISEYCASCQKRLQWIAQVGAKRGLRKPNMDEVRQAKVRSRCNVYIQAWIDAEPGGGPALNVLQWLVIMYARKYAESLVYWRTK